MFQRPTNRPGRWRQTTLLLGLAAASSCEAPTTRQAPAAAPPVAAPLPKPVPPPLPSAAQLGYHRYVGTVGGRPVLAEIELRTELNEIFYPDTVWAAKLESSFYDRTTGQPSGFGSAEWFHPAQWLETYAWDYRDRYNHRRVRALCAEQPPGGPLLTGWYYPEGQAQPVRVQLREDYTDGVRYELLTESSALPTSDSLTADYETVGGGVEQIYLHLLGPDTLRPALARLQCPLPAARHRARLARSRRLPDYEYLSPYLEVTLNEADLLAYTYHDLHRTKHEDIDSAYCRLLDLRTGRTLSVAGQFRPGTLQRLLTRQARADTVEARYRAFWWHNGQLPLASALLTIELTGITASYSTGTMPSPYEPLSDSNRPGYSQHLTWAALRPLLRPNSPLHRLLRIRGL
ncbi:hypothetical protein EJV47_02895 [Hymenobacter gummosus]|uniref:Uncharacterized protein n=1 Tax=Hymenobacter gummosus TaxID=1776032 RepID=A0A431U943_9BACT|nr:hypothetical protein [Hymenobacter gummosus]RTQ53699.1 hypothetical protein EJV47_02895 [Hymenobacter gummosus]